MNDKKFQVLKGLEALHKITIKWALKHTLITRLIVILRNTFNIFNISKIALLSGYLEKKIYMINDKFAPIIYLTLLYIRVLFFKKCGCNWKMFSWQVSQSCVSPFIICWLPQTPFKENRLNCTDCAPAPHGRHTSAARTSETRLNRASFHALRKPKSPPSLMPSVVFQGHERRPTEGFGEGKWEHFDIFILKMVIS